MTIISGGQTGVDRAALDAALEYGIECGGWAPANGEAEDGPIPEKYPLTRAPFGSYRERTLRNVLDASATLILYFGRLSGGTEETLSFCIQHRRPYQLIDAREVSARRAVELLIEFVRQNDVEVLNVAGPRASEWPEGFDYALRVMRDFCGYVIRGINPQPEKRR